MPKKNKSEPKPEKPKPEEPEPEESEESEQEEHEPESQTTNEIKSLKDTILRLEETNKLMKEHINMLEKSLDERLKESSSAVQLQETLKEELSQKSAMFEKNQTENERFKSNLAEKTQQIETLTFKCSKMETKLERVQREYNSLHEKSTIEHGILRKQVAEKLKEEFNATTQKNIMTRDREIKNLRDQLKHYKKKATLVQFQRSLPSIPSANNPIIKNSSKFRIS